ncbi:MAG: patatin-like phospholipase family protein [Paludibacteraceae bacterium]|nr:patatin-like phospholipase family protein [Paludibacteraceae bacterium]MBR0064670.1 patatin-like phospholipase family protein [Paludibacteraceae bacterium]MBR4563811.1 patatin-like phospholipase family protein [Paludibacteraceae bacterium]
MVNKRVALVLGSGGARGLAHIGAIEALEEQGYTITSIAGCSMGAIIAGMYAAGQLEKAKEWFLRVDKQLILRMMDINLLSSNSLVKGKRIIAELEKVVPDRPIESLNIPCTIVASDMMSTEEVLFRSGSLFEAVRASISIPLFFQPVQMGGRLLIDGGILNPLPLHVVERTEGDILVAMDISGKDSMPTESTPEPIDVESILSDVTSRGIPVPKSWERQLRQLAKNVDKLRAERAADLNRRVNFFEILDRMSDMQIQQNTLLALQLTPPDVHAVMRQYAYNTFDFDKAEEIIAEGKRLMTEALISSHL